MKIVITAGGTSEKIDDVRTITNSSTGRLGYAVGTAFLQQYADETDYLYYVDAEAMTYDGQDYRTDLFRKDGIHLNHEGELLWCKDYIAPMLQQIQ